MGIVGKLCFQGHWAPCWDIQPCRTRLSFLHLFQGSLDNMTCILVCFPGAPRPHEEAIRKEQELDAVLGRRVAGEQAPGARRQGWSASRGTPITPASFSELCSSAQEPPSLNTVFRTLASEDIHDLPPGGGVYCK